jgi:DnaJ-class molecular chaperone
MFKKKKTMNFLSRLFSSESNKIECPRCLGKGHVDNNDIKRLGKELKWRPGSCAYCKGSGTVNAAMVRTVPVDLAYLVNELPQEEEIRS